MHNIENQCARLISSHATLSQDSPFTLALMLGNLYYFLPKVAGDERQLIQETLREFKEKLRPKEGEALWAEIVNFSFKNKYLLSHSNLKSLNALKEAFIQDIQFIQHARIRSLIQLGTQINDYRVVFVAIIRKHLHAKRLKDPFSGSTFSYRLLNGASAKENSHYLSRYIQKCSSLPLKSLVRLAKQDSKIAKLMLQDFANRKHFFEFSAQLVKQAPQLRKHIAAKWKHCCDNIPLSTASEQEVSILLKDLKKQFPEFSKVKVGKRAARAQVRPDYEDECIPLWQHLTDALTGTTLNYVALSCVAAPMITPLASLFISVGSTLALLSPPARKHVDKAEIKMRKYLGFR